MKNIDVPRIIYLYDEGIAGFYFKQIKDFVEKLFGKIKIRLIKLKEGVVQTRGLLFDFIGTKKTFEIGAYAKAQDACHIIITDKIFVTLDEYNKPHIRASIYGYPSVISTSGIVEGPAKPRQYYLCKQKYTQLRIWEIEEPGLKKKFKGRFIDYQDKRMTQVLKGYIAQAIFFHITQEPFCKNKSCRLYNAHWQEDLIHSQLEVGRFCLRHRKLLEKIKST